MTDKIKEKVLGMNPKKGFLNLLLCAIIFVIIAGAGTIIKFGNRIPEARAQMEQLESTRKEEHLQHASEEENRQQEGNHQKENEQEKEWKNVMAFTDSDYIFLGILVAVVWILLGIYWLYTMAYAACKASQVGANAYLFGILTFFTNLFGVACLWGYIALHAVCPECGKMQSRDANYCSACGAAVYRKCPECGTRISVKDAYCKGCGKKLSE